jgi:hypothetical protein
MNASTAEIPYEMDSWRSMTIRELHVPTRGLISLTWPGIRASRRPFDRADERYGEMT